jgi:cellulose synthase/poly-beta-1,6-N-acetylglucosamine synthase-like glycosyltransferase
LGQPFMAIATLLIAGLNLGLALAAGGVLLLTLALWLECMAAVGPLPPSPSGQRSAVAILMPAHNEELGLAATLDQLMPQLQPADRLIVIADNCTDTTAVIARAAGAQVIERTDAAHRGKGYALDFGLKFLAAEPPAVVVVLDADCWVQPGAIEHLGQMAIATGCPVQSTYLMAQPDQPSAQTAISAFAFKVKNFVRLKGLARLGLPSLLTGTGMAFPWATLQSVNLASGHIVEDMKLGLDLAIAGHPPIFCPTAQVLGQFPQAQPATTHQRTRWEHGHLQTLRLYGPRLLQAAVVQGRWQLVWVALDFCIPPLSLLVLLWVGIASSTVAAGLLGASWLPAGLSAIAGGCLFSAILTAWATFGRTELPVVQLLTIPRYVLGKIPLYLKFLVKPERRWIRTERG